MKEKRPMVQSVERQITQEIHSKDFVDEVNSNRSSSIEYM